MYKLTLNNETFNIPKENIKLLAIIEAKKRNKNVLINTKVDAIMFLETIGVKVEEY